MPRVSIAQPTPIQASFVPAALGDDGAAGVAAVGDLVGLAPTGTGKTIAYGIPLADHLLKNKPVETGGRRRDPRNRLRAIIDAFIGPVLRLRASPEGEYYALLVARELRHTGPEADRVLRDFFDPLAHALGKLAGIFVHGTTKADDSEVVFHEFAALGL
jgi:hypothetical protein